jgi:hypothetical protein
MYGRPQRTAYNISGFKNGKRVSGGICGNTDPKHMIKSTIKSSLKSDVVLSDDELQFIINNVNHIGFWCIKI